VAEETSRVAVQVAAATVAFRAAAAPMAQQAISLPPLAERGCTGPVVGMGRGSLLLPGLVTAMALLVFLPTPRQLGGVSARVDGIPAVWFEGVFDQELAVARGTGPWVQLGGVSPRDQGTLFGLGQVHDVGTGQ
jgi:hypothetical protein